MDDKESEISIPVPIVLHVAQQIVDDSSPLLSFTSRLSQLQKLRMTSVDVAEMMDVIIWPQFVRMYVRKEYHSFGGPFSSVSQPKESLLARMPDFMVLKLYLNMCVDPWQPNQHTPYPLRSDMVDQILDVSESRWKWIPIKRELRACLTTGMSLSTADEMYCLGKAMRDLPRIKLQSGRMGVCKEHAMNAAMARWGTMAALEAHKATKAILAEKRRVAKELRRSNMDGLCSKLEDLFERAGASWNIDQLIYFNPTLSNVFKRYATSPSQKNLDAARKVVENMVQVRADNIQRVNDLFADASSSGSRGDVWRISSLPKTEQSLLSVPAMKLIYTCEQQCGRLTGVQPLVLEEMARFAGRLRAVRKLWMGSVDTPIVQFPTQLQWMLGPTQRFLDGSGVAVEGIGLGIANLKALHKVYMDGVELIKEYNAKITTRHVRYITDAVMMRALSVHLAPQSPWDILSNAMSITQIDLCCTIVKAVFARGYTTTGCNHIHRHMVDAMRTSASMDREEIIGAACDTIIACQAAQS